MPAEPVQQASEGNLRPTEAAHIAVICSVQALSPEPPEAAEPTAES